MSNDFWDDGFDEDDEIECYDCDEELIDFVQKRYGNIRFFGSAGTLPPGYKQCARTACSNDIGLVYGFYVAYINPKRNKFTIRYTNEYDPWGHHYINQNENKKMPNMQDWETMIAERNAMHGTVVTCLIEDATKRNRRNYDRRYDKSPKRIAQHKAWEQSPAGKKSSRERNKRWRATEKGKIACRRKSRNYFLKHCNDPVWRAKRLEAQQSWKAKRRAKKILSCVPFENTITLQDIGTITVYIYKGVA